MKRKTLNFYNSKGLQPQKLFVLGKRKNISPEKIAVAMEQVYRDHKNGNLIIKDIDIPRYIFEKARREDTKKYEQEQVRLQISKKINYFLLFLIILQSSGIIYLSWLYLKN